MKKILLLAGSNHSKSIHYQLLNFTKTLITDCETTVLDIRNWTTPVYSIDMDPDETPEEISQLIDHIKSHDGFIFGSPEHNGAPSAFFKNILDWLSRRGNKVFDNKPMMLMSTSGGPKAGATHLSYLGISLPYQNAEIKSSYSLPSFNDNFKNGEVEGEELVKLKERLEALISAL